MTEQEIFVAALEKDPVERAAFLDAACAGNAELRRGVETLLRLHAESHGFLDVPVLEQLSAAPAEPENAAPDLSFLAPSSEPGSLGRLDHYEILEVIGRGGTGVVLRARDTKLLRIVALKVLAAALAVSGTARQRFVREARAAAAVRDDHVIDIHAVRDDAPMPYLVMEYIDGCNLDTLLRKGGPLEVKEILRIGIQVARGLAAAHQHGLIHRDVKPANILLENGVQRVKLTDFGLARAAADASLTQTGFIAGTPLYMAPEQAAGEPIDARADLFSLGSVLYALCTGKAAFRAETTVAVIKRVCEETPRPIREINPDIPESLCRVIERLHAKKPAERPASASEVAELLTGLLADVSEPRTQRSGVSGRSSAYSAALRARLGRRKWFWAVAALLLLFAGLGLGEATGVTDVRGTVIRLFAPEGTLVVEVDDPGVSVTVDGADIVITGAGAREIRLKAGQYQVEASKDGKLFRRELVTVARNGRKVVRISKEAGPGGHVANVIRAKADRLPADHTNTLGMTFKLIPAGKFAMGSPQQEIDRCLESAGEDEDRKERLQAEVPEHDVEITRPFYLGTTEVTVGQFQKFVAANPTYDVGDERWKVLGVSQSDNHPVVWVSWKNAVDFCMWLSEKEGKHYRLPTEAEWEYSCRAGKSGTRYCYGDDEEQLDQYAWYGKNSDGRTHPVGTQQPNAWGLHDMHGNAWEWCKDYYDANYYRSSPVKDPIGPFTGIERVGRGGAYELPAAFCRSAHRGHVVPGFRSFNLGFRVLLVAPPG
jgi:formylglycine-generating enzyme required for sulfatase activity/tRNA A-37 threonylcarbamoyl transferase component Bud32